jgi:hypothetical protein
MSVNLARDESTAQSGKPLMKSVCIALCLSALTVTVRADSAVDDVLIAERLIGFHGGCLDAVLAQQAADGEAFVAGFYREASRLCIDQAHAMLPASYARKQLSSGMQRQINRAVAADLARVLDWLKQQGKLEEPR